MKPILSHSMLVANAGSGKTYALTTRMVKLLALGVDPRRIAALTFTRKAAGEFLDAVFARLAEAALDAGALARLVGETGRTDLDAAGCRTILRRLSDQLGGLMMGTIDSMFARIARVFPLESGIPGDFAILGGADLGAAREEALAALFAEYAGDPRRFAAFIELVRQQSRRRGERDVFNALLEAVTRFHDAYLRTPRGVAWGERDEIWPRGCAILRAGEPPAAAEKLWSAIRETHGDLADEAVAQWRAALDEVAAWVPGQPWSDGLKKFVDRRLCASSTDPKSGEEYLPTGNARRARVHLNDRVRAARTALLHALVRPELESLLRRSAALHALIGRFENLYDAGTRGRGRLTFGDITALLAGRVEDPGWLAAAGYRLDARLDHWMLDEFQDTSRPQWRVLSAFIDEVVQDAGGQRSFFYVGDTKQAIYGWRGGDPRLFFEIRNHYNQGGEERIGEGSLTQSFRSTAEILDAVNGVFGGIRAVAGELGLPDRTVSEWEEAWRTHGVSERTRDRTGYVRWAMVSAEDESSGEDEENGAETDPQDLEIVRILREVEPWRRGWSCAVLKRDNRKVAAVAARLQAVGIPVAVEGKSNPCTDNPLGTALLLAFRCMATPADRFTAALLAGSPLGRAVLADGVERFREAGLRSVAASGFAATARGWIEAAGVEGEPFLEQRATEFLSAAAAFDAQRRPGDGLLRFLAFIEEFEVQQSESADVVRVMTIHQAKGLTFDMTIVAGLDALVKDRTPGELFLAGEAERVWGLLLPKRDFALQDEVLAAAREQLLAGSAYGELCAAYVAMTRPRFGLYLVTRAVSAKSRAKNFARLLDLTLGRAEPCYQRGDPRWFERNAERADSGSGEGGTGPKGPPMLAPPLAGTPRPLSPSDAGESGGTAGGIGDAASGGAALGSEVHAALAAVEWLGEHPPAFAGCSREARKLLLAFFDATDARSIFAPPAGRVRLWRERAFDVVIEGRWVGGVFDRVQIAEGPDGQPVAAVVYDFKTDRGSEESVRARYAGQMDWYRRAAAALLGLPEAAVEARVVLVR
jgi:ATP-dependent helicase/nuclease subunit A